MPIDQLARRDTAILLENALLDTSEPANLPIPSGLKGQGDPGAYIVQSRGPVNATFRDALSRASATIVAYIPNNAFLVRANAQSAQELAALPEIQAVLPYEPYYKLKPSLLAMVLADTAVPNSTIVLNALLFGDGGESTVAELPALLAKVLRREASPFGPVVSLALPVENITRLAGLTGVQELEETTARVTANDLTRSALGVAVDSTTPASYLGLTGHGVTVNVNDTGVDASQPDLAGRVSFDAPLSGTDTNGHGTHVAGIIAGSGAESLTVTNAAGSVLPPSSAQFRGMAPGAAIFSVGVDLNEGPKGNDSWVQQTAVGTNILISNNSWLYSGQRGYDLAAASYDAAVRDALPTTPGPQPLLFVFAAANTGAGADNGTGGIPDSIQSPATAKNVITVGAIEHPRGITNQNWLGLTDSSNQVAAFSSRGNVGQGCEGEFGRFKPDVVAPGTFIVSTRSGQWNQSAYYSQANLFCSSPDASCSQALSNLNNGLGPFYRYESGTSLAAAAVSGTLALMQEFFEQRLGRTNSPALMKALLINGARSLGGAYDLQVQSRTNFQGWGLVNLPNSIPGALTNLAAAANSMLALDQAPTEALVTGQSRTRFLSLSPAARSLPLRVTLAWTDPPGNPVAGIKLVNDLDLLVTNLDTGEVYFGNDFPPGTNFTKSWDGLSPPNSDFVNNVENVYLAPGLGAHYSVTVFGRRVTVNAVTADAQQTAQDYALVISSGNGEVSDALTLTDGPTAASAGGPLTLLTNGFSLDGSDFGSVLPHQRIGANAPLGSTQTVPIPGGGALELGSTNQWQFYVFTNSPAFTNVAFLTFSAVPLSPLPGSESIMPEADVDLYVSTDPGLTNLDPNVLANADSSTGRGGTEWVAYTNASASVYFIGVKCESQEGADYGFAAVATEAPFAQADPSGNQILQGFMAPVGIPGGTPGQLGLSQAFALLPGGLPVRRVIVTNTLSASSLQDLRTVLTHSNDLVVLNNFSPGGPLNDRDLVYDDSGEGDIAGAQPTDGPGSLLDFGGVQGLGLWQLTFVDTNRPATNDGFELFLEQQQDLTAGISPTLAPGACRQDYVYVPASATNLTTIVSFVSGTGPLSFQVCRQDEALTNGYTLILTDLGTNALMVLDPFSHPPLNPGTYIVRVCNLGPDPAQVSIGSTPMLDVGPPPQTLYSADVHSAIPDDAISTSIINVTNAAQVLSVEVGVRIDHPRVSDLALSLISPNGTRVLLDENRGGSSVEGLGSSVYRTNAVPYYYSGGPEAVTNVIETDETSGVITLSYDFFLAPDTMHVYYDGQLLLDTGLVSGKGTNNIAYGPGTDTFFTIVMNEGGNADSNTVWSYTVRTSRLEPVHLTFTEDTNLTTSLIKFAVPPLTNYNYFATSYIPSNGIYFLPEQSLDRFAGTSAQGPWKLELLDRRAGATVPTPTLLSWQLGLRFLNSVPLPIVLPPSTPITNLIGAGQIQWYAVDGPEWISFATNSLLFASAPVNLLYNQATPPTGTNAGDFTLLASSTGGTSVLATNSSPPLIPGSRWYLGVQNTNATGVGFALQVDFDVESIVTLQSAQPVIATNWGPTKAVDYYRYVVSSNAVRAQFEINGPTAGLELVARRGLPLPRLNSYDYLSANPGTNDQLIVVYDFSQPVPLSAGEWFLGVVNMTGVSAGYSILATEFADYGTNIVITGESVTSSNACLTWTSLSGVHYYIEGKATLEDTNWVTLSPTLTATDVSTSYCLDLPSPFTFFRVEEGLVITPPPLIISAIQNLPQGVLLSWSASTNAQFQVLWSSSVTPPAWSSFTNHLTSPTGDFSFLDDGSQSGGLGPRRFYRLVQLP